MVFLHVQLQDGETARICLLATLPRLSAALGMRVRRNLLLCCSPLNPKTLGGVVTLSSTAFTRLFFDSDIDEMSSYMASFIRKYFSLCYVSSPYETLEDAAIPAPPY